MEDEETSHRRANATAYSSSSEPPSFAMRTTAQRCHYIGNNDEHEPAEGDHRGAEDPETAASDSAAVRSLDEGEVQDLDREANPQRGSEGISSSEEEVERENTYRYQHDQAAGTAVDAGEDDRVPRRTTTRRAFIPRRRRGELCVAFSVLTMVVVVGISVPLVLTRSSSSSNFNSNDDGSKTMSVKVVSEGDALLQIAIDSGHSCAIREDDLSVFCWGSQMGVPANLFQVTQIAVGDGFTCAIQDDSSFSSSSFSLSDESSSLLVCWGEDRSADLVQPPADLGAVSFVTASGGTVCAVERSTGTGRCWGLHEEYGRIEFSIPEEEQESSSLSVGRRRRLKSIAAPKQGSLKRVCGIWEADDSVQCWTIHLNLDENDNNNNTEAMDIQEDLTITTPTRSLAVMEDFVCAVSLEDSSLQCQSFDGTTTTSTANTKRNPLPDIPTGTTSYTHVVPGIYNQFCAIQTFGTPICFRDGKPTFIPAQVGNVQQISMGRNHICAIQQDSGYGICWGVGASPGQLAPWDKDHPIYYAKAVAAGDGRMCAIGIYRDMVDCWGKKRYQLIVDASDVALGDEVTCVVDSSDDAAKCVFGGGTFILSGRVKQVEVSPNDLICTIGKFDDVVRCYRPTCQRATFQNYLNCFGVPKSIGNGRRDDDSSTGTTMVVHDLKLSQRHFCSITKYTKNLECGSLLEENVLLANNETLPPEAQVPSDLLPVRDVALGRFFTCAVQDNYEIRCWGDGTKYGSEYVLDPPKGSYYRAIVATDYEACAITLDHFVHCWGRPFISSIYVPSDVRFVDKLTAGSGHVCAVLENQEVICWGSNRYGELKMDYLVS